jgi:hypothetical protein
MARVMRICLVTPGHLGSNPRVVKEADALVEAGFQVHVISGDSFPGARDRDASILEQARWSSEIIRARPGRATYLFRRLRQMICRSFYSAGFRIPFFAIRAHHVLVPVLTSAAVAARADFYIGHCLAALPAVVKAGSKNKALVGFDAEDFHSGEATDQGNGRLDNAIARTIESQFLGRCKHLTASSLLIAQEYGKNYGVAALPVLNVFPLCESVDPLPPPALPLFYWFSQTIGEGRGLEEFIDILRKMQRRAILDVRGHVAESYGRQLQKRVEGTLVELRQLPPEIPKSMVGNASGYTAGLGLELSEPLNRDLCITNKAFTYLLAGVPVILSRTRAQDGLAAELGDAALSIDLKNVEGSARQLAEWLENTEVQAKARKQAFKLGRDIYNWDREKLKFIAAVNRTIERGQRETA